MLRDITIAKEQINQMKEALKFDTICKKFKT